VSVINTAAVEDVALGPNGIVAVGRGEGKILVDHSTTELDATQRIAAALAERCGMMFVDAPVSGGPGAAKAGELAIMAGGLTANRGALPRDHPSGRFTAERGRRSHRSRGSERHAVPDASTTPVRLLCRVIRRLVQGARPERTPIGCRTGPRDGKNTSNSTQLR